MFLAADGAGVEELPSALRLLPGEGRISLPRLALRLEACQRGPLRCGVDLEHRSTRAYRRTGGHQYPSQEPLGLRLYPRRAQRPDGAHELADALDRLCLERQEFNRHGRRRTRRSCS